MSSFIKQTVLVFTLLVGIFGFCAVTHATGGAWQVVGEADFSSTTITTVPIVVDSHGTPYVAYEDSSNGNKATVMKFNGSEWVVVGGAGFSPDQAGDISLTLDPDDTPYVMFANAASSSRAMVMKYNGSNWITVGNEDFSTTTISGTKIVFSPAGVPYVAFTDGDFHITVMKLNISTWEMVGDPYTSARGAVPVLAFNRAGTPYVAFSDVGTGQPTVIQFDGTDWNLVGNPIASVNLAANVSFAISPSDTLYLGGADVSNNFLQTFTFDGTDWVQIGTTGTEVTTGNTVMAFSPTGTLYIAFEQDTEKATVKRYNGSDWETFGDAEFSTKARTLMSLAINPSGVPYVAYSDFEANKAVVMAFLPTTPGPVVGLSPLPQSARSITLSWHPPVDNGGSTVTGYQIERESPVGSGFSVVATVSAGSTAYTDTFDLNPVTFYNYRVSAINNRGRGTVSDAQGVSTPSEGGAVFVPVAPTSLMTGGKSSIPLSFTLNAGAVLTKNRTVTAALNGNPQTVRGYVISLDPTFSHDSIFPYNVDTHSAVFTLPDVPGTYTVYFKYYSVTGIYSPVFSQTIAYQPSITPENFFPPKIPSISSAFQTPLFKRPLKLGSQGPDVKALQVFLNTHGFLVSSSGVGSPGRESSLYGKLTASAVTKFQEAHASEVLAPLGLTKGTGIFGSATIKAVNLKK